MMSFLTIFSLYKVNQERVNSLFVQVQCASSVFYYFTMKSTVKRVA